MAVQSPMVVDSWVEMTKDDDVGCTVVIVVIINGSRHVIESNDFNGLEALVSYMNSEFCRQAKRGSK